MFSGESGGVYRGMLTLLMGAGLARIVGLASIPILTRLYSPDDYGILAIYTSIVAILVPVMTFRYVTAIPLPRTDAMAFNLFVLCAKLIVLGTLFIGMLLAIYGETILGWFSMEELADYWWLITIGVIGAASYELFSMWATRKKDYKTIARTQFGQSLLGNLVKLGLGMLAVKPLGLIVGQVMAESGGIGGYLKRASIDFKKLAPLIHNKKQIMLASYYQDFPKYRLPSQFLMVLSVQAPVMMMAALYSAGPVGQFGLAKMALVLPSSLIGQSVSKAYYAEVAAIGKSDFKKIKRISLDVTLKLLVLGSAPMIILFLLAPWLFPVVFGESWRVAGEYSQILAPYILLMLASTPLLQVLNVVGSQRVFLLLNVLRGVSLLALFMLAQYFRPTAYGFVVWFTVSSIFYALLQIGVVFYYVNKSARMGKSQ